MEPRRVAAKAAARRMAALLGEPVGATVGYRVKLESRVSKATRIEVVTEGILLRRLQQDPELEVGDLGVSAGVWVGPTAAATLQAITPARLGF